MKVDHIVPLATQAVEILRNLHPTTGHGRYVFPSIRTGERPMSENTISAALRGMGYSAGVRTAHLPARREMMERWADYLDKLAAGAEIIQFVQGGLTTQLENR